MNCTLEEKREKKDAARKDLRPISLIPSIHKLLVKEKTNEMR